MHTGLHHVKFDLVTKAASLVTFDPSTNTTTQVPLTDFKRVLTESNGFIKNGLLTREGFLQVNALIAIEVKPKLKISEDQTMLTTSVIGDNNQSMRHAELGHPDDTASMGGQATVRALPSNEHPGAYTNLTVGVLTMNTHGSRDAFRNVFTCKTPHTVPGKDVRASVTQAHQQLEYLANNNPYPVVAVHYYANDTLSYGLGHARDSGAHAVLTATESGSDATFYERTMFQSSGAEEAKTEPTSRPAAPTGDTLVVKYSHPGGKVEDLSIVSKNLKVQVNAKGFDSGSKKTAASHALCCASSFAWRTAAEGGASGGATGEDKDEYGTFPRS